MKFGSVSQRFPIFIQHSGSRILYQQQKLQFTTFLRKLQSTTTGGARASMNYGAGGGSSNNGSSQGIPCVSAKREHISFAICDYFPKG